MTLKRRDETCCKTLCWTPHTTHTPRKKQRQRRSLLGSDRLEPSNSSLRVLRSPCPPSAVGGRFGLVEREGGDGKEREGGQRVDQNVGQKDIKRETEAKKKRKRRSQPHTTLPLFLRVKENRSVKRRETESSSSFSFSSVVSIVESQIDLKGRPRHPNGFPPVEFPRPPVAPF